MKLKVLALKGYAGAGKTTVEKALYWLMSFDNDVSQFTQIDIEDILNPDIETHQFIGCKDGSMPIYIARRSFADPIKDCLSSLMNCHPSALKRQDVKESLQPDLFDNLTVRDMHLKVADAIKECTNNEDIFADAMKRVIVRLHNDMKQHPDVMASNVLLVIDDLRYPFEHEMLQHLVLENVIDNYVCVEVKTPNIDKPTIKHSSEIEQSKIVPDFVYVNNKCLQQDIHQLIPIIDKCLEDIDDDCNDLNNEDDTLSAIIKQQTQERMAKRQQRLKDAGLL